MVIHLRGMVTGLIGLGIYCTYNLVTSCHEFPLPTVVHRETGTLGRGSQSRELGRFWNVAGKFKPPLTGAANVMYVPVSFSF